MKKEGGFVFLIWVSTILMLGLIVAQENHSHDAGEDIAHELEEEYGDEELGATEGITPDSPFYFVDNFLIDLLMN